MAAAQAAQADVNRQKEIGLMAETIAESIWKDGQLNTARRVLRQLLTDRFGPLPQELLQRIESSDDLERLLAAVSQVSRLAGPDDLKI